MKNLKLLTLLSLIPVFSLAGCKGNAGSDSSSVSPSVPEQTSSSSNGSHEISPDPYAQVLDGLDKSKDLFHDGSRQTHTYLGGYTETVNGVKVSYGWIEYTSTWGTYGVAVKLTITAEGKIKEIKLGAPDKDVHNFTPSYGQTSGYDIYNDYIANYEKNLNAAFANKSVRNAFNSLKDAVCEPNLEPTETDSGTFTPSKNDPTVKAGATQTAARTERAIFAAAGAYLSEYNPNARVFAHVYNNLKAEDRPTDNNVSLGYRKTTDGSYGYARYQSWGSYYGAAVKIKVKANNVIDHVYLGTPRKDAHNFTPWYAVSDPNNFIEFYQKAEELVNNQLVGKVVNEQLRNKYKSATLEPGTSTFTPAETILSAGATQTNVRLDRAIASAREGILSSVEAKPDEGGVVDEVLPGADTISGSEIYASYNHLKSDYVTPEENQNGYYNAQTMTAYGWRRYENPWSKGSYYGAAVSLTFDKNKNITDVKVGVSQKGDVNRTTIYRAHYDSDPLYLDNYAQYLIQDRKAALSGKTAADVYKSTLSAGVENNDGNLIFTPGDYDFLGAGATQTTSRINVALFEAASAYRLATDPFTKNVFEDLKLVKGTDIKDNTFHQGGKKGTDSKTGAAYVYGYTVYYISSWQSYYGAAVKLTYDNDRKITAVETGEPKIEDSAKSWAAATNFTASYTFTSTSSRSDYLKYYTTVKAEIDSALIGKTINEELAQQFAAAKVEFDPNDSEKNTYTPASVRFIGAGATQTDTRIAASIYGALQAALKK